MVLNRSERGIIVQSNQGKSAERCGEIVIPLEDAYALSLGRERLPEAMGGVVQIFEQAVR